MTNPNPTPADKPACEACRDIRGICPDCVDEPAGDNENTERYIERLENLSVMRRKHITTLRTRISELEGENENYTLVMLRIDNYCRVNDIDITEAVKGE